MATPFSSHEFLEKKQKEEFRTMKFLKRLEFWEIKTKIINM